MGIDAGTPSGQAEKKYSACTPESSGTLMRQHFSQTVWALHSSIWSGMAMEAEDVNKKPTASKTAISKRFLLLCEKAFIIVSSVAYTQI